MVTEALGPYFKDLIIKDIGDSEFVVLYDETTNSCSKKELKILVRYISNLTKRVEIRHMATYFIVDGTAKTIKDHLFDAIDSFGLRKSKLVMLGSDGPHVNKKVFKICNEELKELGYGSLLDIGTCNLHVVNNVFLHALEAYGIVISDLIIDIYNFFDDWPTRRSDFEDIQKRFKIERHCFIKHVPTRWTTIEPAAKRVLEQIGPLKEYIFKFIPNNKKTLMTTNKYKKIEKLLKDKYTLPILHLVIESCSLFRQFLLTFQRSEPMIHAIYESLVDLLSSLLHKITLSYSDTFSTSLDNVIYSNVALSENILMYLKSFKEIDNLHFQKCYTNHFCNELAIVPTSRMRHMLT